jgi:hypothetical protein
MNPITPTLFIPDENAFCRRDSLQFHNNPESAFFPKAPLSGRTARRTVGKPFLPILKGF